MTASAAECLYVLTVLGAVATLAVALTTGAFFSRRLGTRLGTRLGAVAAAMAGTGIYALTETVARPVLTPVLYVGSAVLVLAGAFVAVASLGGEKD